MGNRRRASLILDFVESIAYSWWTVVAGLCIGVLASWLLLAVLPSRSKTTATVRIGRTDAARHVDPAREIERTVFGSETILEALSRVTEASRPSELDEWLPLVRRDLRLSRPGPDGIVELSYQDRDAERSEALLDALAQVLVERTVAPASSPGDAPQLLELQEKVEAMQQQAAAQGEALAAFITRHPILTDESREADERTRAGLQRDLEANGKALEAARERLATLQARRQTRDTLPECDEPDLPSRKRLVQLEAELTRLAATEAADSPSTVAKTKELESLLLGYVPTREELRSHLECLADPGRAARPASPSDDQIDKARVRISGLEADRDRLNKALQERGERRQALPAKQQELAELRQAHAESLAAFEQRQDELGRARRTHAARATIPVARFEIVGRSLTESSRSLAAALAFVVLLLGPAVGLAVFVGPLIVKGLLNPLISSEAGLRAVSPVPVLVSVPLLAAHEVVQANRKRMLRNIMLSLTTVVLTGITVITLS